MTKILIIEDTPIVAEMLTEVLTKERYEVECCMDSAKALQNIKEHEYDVIISDLDMPNIDGETILFYLMSTSRENKLILTSGNSGRLYAAQHDMKLSKPFDFPVLLQMIKNILKE